MIVKHFTLSTFNYVMNTALKKVIFFTLCAIFITVVIWLWRSPAHYLRVIFLDVSQGDSILIITPDGQDILIDGGPDGSAAAKVGKYLPPWDRVIEYVIPTHQDADHITGLAGVLKKYQVRHIVWRPFPETTAVGRTVADLIRRENAEVVTADQRIDVELGEDCDLHIYAPTAAALRPGAATNDTSIVSQLDCAGKRFMFTGDAPQAVEMELIETEDVRSDVVKLGHHGSKTSSAYYFLRAVDPAYAVVSAGRENRYHHPHPSVTAMVKKLGIMLLSTQSGGDVEFRVSAGGIITYN